MLWAHLLAYVTGTVDQELLLRNEYLAAENRMLRGQIKGRLLLSEEEKATLAEIAHRLPRKSGSRCRKQSGYWHGFHEVTRAAGATGQGRKALEEVACTARPDTILGWYRKLIAKKFDGSRFRQRVGRPRVAEEIERLVVRMAKENPSWGYDRIVGAMANLGHWLCDQTVGNILRRHGLSRSEAQANRFVERLYPLTPGRFGRDGLLHGGSPDAQGVAELLCAVLHPLGDSPGEPGRIHAVPGSGVDGAAGAKHDHAGVGMPERLPLSAA